MPSQEFNFYCDPEAAKVVMAKFSNVVLVPRDLGLTHLLEWDKLEHIMSKPSRVAAFLAGVHACKHLTVRTLTWRLLGATCSL